MDESTGKQDIGAKSGDGNKPAPKGTTGNGNEFERAGKTGQPVDYQSRVARGTATIQRNVYWAMGVGALPFPVIDIFTVTGVQLKMLKELAGLYDVDFKSSRAKKLVYSLLTGVGSVGIGGLFGFSLTKLVPGLGTTLGVVSVPIFAAAFTNAIGKSFLMHFESGGTFLDFDPNAMRSYFRQEYEHAKKAVADSSKQEDTAVGRMP